MDVPVLVHFHFQPFGQRVDDGKPDAVQAAGDLVSAAAELAACVQFGQDEFDRRNALLVMDARRDAAPVVFHRAGAVLVDGDTDGVAISRQRFVDGVVDDLLNEMMQAAFIRGPDIHTGALSDRLQPFENLDLFLAVNALYFVRHNVSISFSCRNKATDLLTILYHKLRRNQSVFARAREEI